MLRYIHSYITMTFHKFPALKYGDPLSIPAADHRTITQWAKSEVFVQWVVYYQIFSQISQKYFMVQKNILSKKSDLDPGEFLC